MPWWLAVILLSTEMDKPASEDVEEIRVIGDTQMSWPVAASNTWLGHDEIVATPIRSAVDALRLVPGFLLVQHGAEGKGQQLFLRGFDAAHGTDVEVRVDGVLVNEASHVHAHGYLDLGFVIPEVVRSVEVTKGPFSVAQGPFAMAASADYRLGLAHDLLGWRAAYTAGTTGRHRLILSVAPEEGDGDSFVAAEAMHDDGFGENRASERVVLLGRWQLLDESLRLTAGAYGARFELPGVIPEGAASAGGVGFFGSLYPDGCGESVRGFVSVDYVATAFEASTHLAYRHAVLQESFTGYLENPTAGDGRRQGHGAWYASAQLRYSVLRSTNVTAIAAAGGHLEVFRQGETAASGERGNLRGLYGLGHGYGQVVWSPASRLRLRGGLRLDIAAAEISGQSTREPLVSLSPRLTLAWTPIARMQLIFSYGRGIRPPAARSFSRNDPGRLGLSEEDAQVNPGSLTTADAIEAGVIYSLSSLLRLSASGFLTLVDRESVYDHISGTNLELNGTRRVGAELVAVARPVSWLVLRGDITLVDARFADSGRQVPFAPWLVAGTGAVVRHESGLRAGLRFVAVAARPLPHGAHGSPLTMLDATVGWSSERFWVALEVENVIGLELRAGQYHFASHWRLSSPASDLPELHYVAGPPINARLTINVSL